MRDILRVAYAYLRRDDGLAEDAPAAHHVLREELAHDDADVWRVDLQLINE